MKTFVMGDVHGAHKALVQVLERSGFQKDSDTLISLGDIVDGWSEVFQCVEELLSIKNLIAIKGNHDEWFNQYLSIGTHPTGWLHGGDGTLESYCANADREIIRYPSNGAWITSLTFADIPASHQKFFREQHLYYVDSKGRMFVHGGFDRDHCVSDTKGANPSEFYWNRSLWDKAMSCTGDQKLNTANNFRHIYIGHTATTNWKDHGGNLILDSTREGKAWKMSKTPITYPLTRGGVTNIDTGAGFNGRLSMMNIDTGEVFQSDLVQELYSKERGRN